MSKANRFWLLALLGIVIYALSLIIKARHPNPAQLAAFADGNLRGRELARIAEHLRICEDCREIVGEATRINYEK